MSAFCPQTGAKQAQRRPRYNLPTAGHLWCSLAQIVPAQHRHQLHNPKVAGSNPAPAKLLQEGIPMLGDDGIGSFFVRSSSD